MDNEINTILLAERDEEDSPGTLEVVSRRDLIQHLTRMGAGAFGAALAGGGAVTVLSGSEAAAQARKKPAAAPPVKRKFHYGMVIDTRRCVGCKSCLIACKAENKTPPGLSYNRLLEYALGVGPDDKPLFMTRPCFHCENPPCVPVCPIGATYKRKEDGIVVVDYDKCMGIGRCVKACPYEVRTMDKGENYPAVAAKTPYAAVPSPEYGQFRLRAKDQPPIGRARKCTFCMHLQDENGRYDKAAGRWPACAKTCTGHAIHFGDFNDPNSEPSILLRTRKAVRLKEALGTNPNVYYLL